MDAGGHMGRGHEHASWTQFWALIAFTVAVVLIGSALIWYTDPLRGKEPVNCTNYGWYKTCEWVPEK